MFLASRKTLEITSPNLSFDVWRPYSIFQLVTVPPLAEHRHL